MNITYEKATMEDTSEIAALHTTSWQMHYRKIYADKYLDVDLAGDRLAVWTQRLSRPNPEQHVLKALLNDRMIGFVCTYLNKDSEYGTRTWCWQEAYATKCKVGRETSS